MNLDGVEKKSEVDNGKGGEEKWFSAEGGSENQSKRDDMQHLDETVAKDHGEKTIIDLPPELLIKIIDMMPISQWPSMESVSRQFQNTVHGLWGQLREIRLDEFACNEVKKKTGPRQFPIVESILKKFLIRAPNVASISGFDEFIDRRTSIQPGTIRLLSNFEHLQTIDFSGRDIITASNFALFLESSASRQSWRSLDIVDGIYEMMNSHNEVVSKNQAALKLECFKFNEEYLHNFDRYLSIDWSRLKKMVIVDSSTSRNELSSIVRQCTQLAHLEIKVPKFENGNIQPSYYGDLMQAVADLENLSILKIIGFWSRDDAFHDALLQLIQHLGRRRITELALKEYRCTDRILGAIIDYLPLLKSLELEVVRCTKPLLDRLANEMSQLEKFRSHGCTVDGAVIRAMVGNMIGLQYLNLHYPRGDSEDFNCLGDLRILKDLGIMSHTLNPSTIETWTRPGFGSCLESLELSILFPQYIPFYGTRPIEEAASVVAGFFKNLPRLRSLKLKGINMTNRILEAVALSSPKLVRAELNLWGSMSITSTAVQSIIDQCSQLKYLKVDGHSEWFPAALRVGKYRGITFKQDE